MSRERGAGTVEDVEEVPPGLEDDPGVRDGDGHWSPIRVAFTRWRVSAPVTPKKAYLQGEMVVSASWEDFGGYVHEVDRRWGACRFDDSKSFLEECSDHHQNWPKPRHGRNLHREEMNLVPAGETLEMYDRFVGREWDERPNRMEFLNHADPLPLVHIIVNNSDGSSAGKGHFDLFFPHELHYGKTDTVCYKNADEFSKQHQKQRKRSAENVGACPQCAIEVDRGDSKEWSKTKGTVYHIYSGPNSRFPTDEIYGYREFGQEITEDMLKGPGGIIVHLPKGNKVDKIYLPRDVVHELFVQNHWDLMKIFPSEDLPSN